MNKSYLLIICLLGASLTGCLDRLSGEDEEKSCDPLPGADCSGVNLSDEDLSGPGYDYTLGELIGLDLQGIDFSSATLQNTNFWGANLSGANFAGADLTGAFLGFADLSNADLSGATLTNAILSQAHLDDANFQNTILKNVSSPFVQGTPQSLPDSWSLVAANLTNFPEMVNALDSNGHESGGFLVGPYANLEDAQLLDTDLSNLDLSGANVKGTNFTRANLTGTNFQNADFSCDVITYSWGGYTSCTQLNYANLSYTDFTDALFVSSDTDEIADFTGTYWKQTIWWDGVAYDENQA
tara:strand:+ start:323 stop:1213 length:891 start_codon:yes stop_codon:yes gene_type:complete